MASLKNAERIKRLAAEIDGVINHPGQRAALIDRLKADEGLTLRFTGGTYTARIAGVAASATSGETDALRVWPKAARRALIKLGMV